MLAIGVLVEKRLPCFVFTLIRYRFNSNGILSLKFITRLLFFIVHSMFILFGWFLDAGVCFESAVVHDLHDFCEWCQTRAA